MNSKTLHRLLTYILTITMVMVNLFTPTFSLAADSAPTPPPFPTPLPKPTAASIPTRDEAIADFQAKLEAAKATPTPRPIPTPKTSSSPAPTPDLSQNSTPTASTTSTNPSEAQTLSTDTASLSVTPSQNPTQSTPSDSELITGNSLVTATIYSSPNTNQQQGSSAYPSTTGTNSGNGAYSTNNTGAYTQTDDLTVQDNQAGVVNDLEAGALSGENINNANVGNSTTTTGDANTIATVVTSANTNMAGVNALEFNVLEDHVGDIILDFDQGCQPGNGCQNGEVTFLNSGNGAISDNTNTLTDINTDQTFQANDADVVNNIYLTADSGSNQSDFNTGGDTHIQTGDANIVANVANFLNNNISGNIIFSTVNIMADLVGNIIVPGDTFSNATNLSSAGNGAYSTNTNDFTTINNTDTYQENFANIDNDIEIITTTGDNQANFNTHPVDANTQDNIQTGNSSADVSVANIANQNIVGDWWIVLVNEMGNWVGKIMGAPDGANMAGSTGTEFIQNSDGTIDIINTGNGAFSDNSNSVYQETNTTTSQSNTAQLQNNIILDANSGGNQANFNTGGTSTITTGDTNVLLDLVNFVNNNITGGNVMVTVVNVFGSWVGDFVSPEASHTLPDPGIGGQTNIPDQTTDPSSPPPAGNDSQSPSLPSTPPSSDQNPESDNTPDPNLVDNNYVELAQNLNNQTDSSSLSSSPPPTPHSTPRLASRLANPSVLGQSTWYLTEKLDSTIALALIDDSQKAHQPKQLTVTFAWPTVISTLIGLVYTSAKAKGIFIG